MMRCVVLFLLSIVYISSFGQKFSESWKDLNYADDTMNYHMLDIYLPETEKEAYPVVVVIYGSAWFGNSYKGADMKTLGNALLDAGFAVVTPNHRASTDATFPAQIHDIKASIRYIRGNAGKYRLDTSFIGITGSSSGGHLAALAATSGKMKEHSVNHVVLDLEGDIGSFTDLSSTVDAVVDWFGPTDFLVMDSCGSNMTHNAPDSPESRLVGGPIQENAEKCALANPISYIDFGDPPFLIFHGDKDPLVPHCQSEILFKALHDKGVASQLVITPDAQHGPGVHTEEHFSMMVDFFQKILCQQTGPLPANNQLSTAFRTGHYRNLFREAGYKEDSIDQKIDKAFSDLFEGPDRVYFEVGDSFAYISDLKNHDIRSEGMSYGMMIAVQLDKKEVFDRLWLFSKKYMQHHQGPLKGYFAWNFNPEEMKRNHEGPASDGELYYITSLLFASNFWGNETGIDYYGEARSILDAMWEKDGTGGVVNLIDVEHKQITFVPVGRGAGFTDPSYHVPAFFEVWAEYARDGHEQFYRDCADSARKFLHRACHPVTGLNADHTKFSGEPSTTPWMPSAFRFDSWRVPMNIAMDYVWCGKDKEWQEDYAERFQNFLRSRGISTFEDQFNLDGTIPEFILPAGGYQKLRHSLGLVATAASTTLIYDRDGNMDFLRELWNAKLEPYEDGYFDPYYDGLLYLFGLMHLSGKYRIITPTGNCP